MRPAPPPPRWGSHPARRVACYMYPSPTRYSIEHKAVCVPPFFPLPSRPPSLPPPLYPWATLGRPYPPSFPTHHALRPPPHPPAQNIWPACSLRGGRSVHPHVYPCADVSMAHRFGCCARTSRRVLTPGRACSPAVSRGWGYGRRGCQTRSSRPSSCAPGYGGWGFRVCMHLQTSEFMVRVLGYHEDWSKFTC